MAAGTGTEWTMELGHMAIFGGTGQLRDPETEREIYEHILNQQMAQQEEEVGFLQILNFYTRDSVADVEIWLRDESYRHEHYDEDTERRGKFLAFEGERFPDGSRFKVHIELSETVEETLRVIAACAYGGDVPGDKMEFVLEHLNTPDIMNSLRVAGAGEKTWREILLMKPVAWTAPININIEMTMHNPHAVVVSAAAAAQ